MTQDASGNTGGDAGTDTPTGMVDWDLAVRIGSRIVGDGPSVTPAEAAAVVAELRAGAHRSTGLVADFTGLRALDDRAPVLVVDRPGWVQANAQGFAKIIEPLAAKLNTKADGKGGEAAASTGGMTKAVGSRVTGAEVGLLLGFLGSKVLGQFDPFYDPAGRLLLVAPNIVHVQRELDVDPHDFRLWVCLHEETHRVQFTAVPWMREHLFSLMGELTETMEPQAVLGDLMQRATQVARGAREGGGGLLEMLGTPEQRELLDRVTGVMSLLEGHADVVMDGVGPEVIGTVAQIRKKFTQRRAGASSLDRLVRRLLGLEAKMAQYRDGAVFVRTVVDKVGMADFNAVWAEPANLPSKEEIHQPLTWVSRVHG